MRRRAAGGVRQKSARQLRELEACRQSYGPRCAAGVEKLLSSMRKAEFRDADSLARFHDLLLFLRAFPQSTQVAALADELLAGIGQQVERLRRNRADLSLFDDEQFSGIANSVIQDTFTYDVARWLAKRYPQHISVEWNLNEQGRQLAVSLPWLIPLIADDCLVEADTPYLQWLANAAGGNERILPWLLERIESSSLSILQKTAAYDALRIAIAWKLGESSASRTLARRNPDRLFCHHEPLIRRNEVSLADELNSSTLPVCKLSSEEGEAVLDMVRDALTVRYRELYGTTRGDPASVIEADVGRGVQIFLWGLPPERRLPLRAYHAGLTLKNGVPINYIEGISLFEWMEVGFNTFYAFREGETAWIYSKVLHLLHQVSGVTCFSVYPYQLGHENEEAIKSGAFWFYRKLGFRPGRPHLLLLTQKEEARMARDRTHRTSQATLRKLAAHHVFYEFGEGPYGQWDTFSVRNIGFAVEQWMAREFNGDPTKMREVAVARIAQVLGLEPESWTGLERAALQELAPVLSLIADLPAWSRAEKQALEKAIRAKAAADEGDYLHLLQGHAALRKAVLRLGSLSEGRAAAAFKAVARR